MSTKESVLKRDVTISVAQNLSDAVFEKKTSWYKEAEKYGVDWETLRRYCKSILGTDFRYAERSNLSELTDAQARKIYADVVAKKTSWTAEGKKYGVSDVAVRKRCKSLVWDAFENVRKEGFEIEFDCSGCGKRFSRTNYCVHDANSKNFFCTPNCQSEWHKEHSSKWPNDGAEWYAFFKRSAEAGMSLRGMSREMWMSHNILMKQLHIFGIRPVTAGLVEHYSLKPFVRKFPEIKNVITWD